MNKSTKNNLKTAAFIATAAVAIRAIMLPKDYNTKVTVQVPAGMEAPTQINLRPSYQDRSKNVGTVQPGETATFKDKDEENNYCEIQTDSSRGWLSCDRLSFD